MIAKWLLIFVTAAYLGIGIDQFFRKNPGMGIAYVAYAAANVGMMLLAK